MTSSRLPRPRRTGLAAAAGLALVAGLGAVPAAQAAPASDPILVTQNYSQEVVYGHSAACGQDAQWYRRFDLPGDHDASEGFVVSSVTFGNQEMVASSAILTVKVLAIDPADPFTLADLEPIAQTTVEVTQADMLTLTTVPLAAEVPSGKDLVLEVDTPAGPQYYIGGNAAGQTTSAFISSAGCGVSNPTSLSELGLVNSHLLLHANGKAGECLAAQESVVSTVIEVRRTRQEHQAAYADLMDAKAAAAQARADNRAAEQTHGRDSEQAREARARMLEAIAALADARQVNQDAKVARLTATEARHQAVATREVECAQPALPAQPRQARSASPVSPVTGLSAGLTAAPTN